MTIEQYRLQKSGRGGKLFFTPWQEEEFKRLFPICTNAFLQELFGVSRRTLFCFASSMGLKKDKIFVAQNRRRLRKELIRTERARIEAGLGKKTKINLCSKPYTESQRYLRIKARRLGYISGDPEEDLGERFYIFYDDKTKRDFKFENYATSKGLTIKKLEDYA